MKTKRLIWIGSGCLVMFLLLFACSGIISFAEETFQENEWSYVSASMDTSQGIPENAEGRLGYIRSKGVLKVATEPYFAPQEFIDASRSGQDQYVGSDMEMARLIAERMGVRLEIVPMDFSKVLTSVIEGECDLAISGLSFTPGRAAKVEFSKGYYFAADSAGSGLLIRKEDRDRIRSMEDLKDCNLVAQRGSLQESLFAERVFNYQEFRRVPSVGEIYETLQIRAADAACVDIDSVQIYLKNPRSSLMLVPGITFRQEDQFKGDRVAARKGEVQLIAFVNGVIDELLEIEQYQQWFDEYSLLAGKLGL